MGLLRKLIPERRGRSIISEPISIITGSLGAGKTLFAIEQADLLRRGGDASAVYQLGINKPDLSKLPELPCPLEQWHVHADAGWLQGAVIIVDEFHKWMPQRATGAKVPDFIQEMGEARKRGVRFMLLTQSGEFDHFLKGTRLNRHFYLSRKSGLPKSTIWEWQSRYVSDPERDKDARESAVMHQWWHPVKRYGSWYESAKSHHFRIRLPWRLWLVPVFLVAVGWFVWKLQDNVLPLMDPAAMVGKSAKPVPASGVQASTQTPGDTDAYLKHWTPLVDGLPWSRPAFADQEVTTKPDFMCVSAGAGLDGEGVHQEASCRCYTEQMTPWPMDDARCRDYARHGVYNPFRTVAESAASEADGKPQARPPAAAATTYSIPGGLGDVSNGYSGVALSTPAL